MLECFRMRNPHWMESFYMPGVKEPHILGFFVNSPGIVRQYLHHLHQLIQQASDRRDHVGPFGTPLLITARAAKFSWAAEHHTNQPGRENLGHVRHFAAAPSQSS